MNKSAKTLANLSIKNLRAHTWLYTRLALAFAVLVFLLCLFSVYALALNGMQSDILSEHAAANQIVSYEPLSGLPDGTESFVAKRFDAEIVDEEEDEEVGDDGFVTVEPKEPHLITLSVDGVECAKIGASDYNFMYNFNRIFAADRLLTDNDRAELNYVYGSNGILIGRLPQAANEVALAEVLWDGFDLTGEQVLGKTVSIVVSRGESFIEISDLVVCGIIKREFVELSGHYSYSTSFTPYLLLSADNAIFADSERVRDVYVYSLPYWLAEEEVDRLERQYDCYFLGGPWLEDMVRISLMQTIATKLFVVVGGALGCSVVLMIFLMMDKLVAVFSRDCGILLSCGIQFKQVKLLLLVMLAWICLFAVVIAAILTSSGVLAINAAIYEYYYMEITVSPATVVALFDIGIAAVALVAFFYYLYAVTKMKRRTIKDFLNTSIN